MKRQSKMLLASLFTILFAGVAFAADMPFHVGDVVKAPVKISAPEPSYPEAALKARISGIVIVECRIWKDGHVSDPRVLKPLPFGLDKAAVDAVKRWKFAPGTLGGQPVDVLFNLTVKFKLNPQEDGRGPEEVTEGNHRAAVP